MARNESKSSENADESCIFCLIAHNRDEETTVLKKDKELVCFKDIYPAAPHHYLVIPTEHIISCKSLKRGNIGLVERMANFGKQVLRDQGITDMEDVRLGFHQPPFTSVDHLHLHVLAPASKISTSMDYKFTPGTDRFITEEYLRKRLEKVRPKVCEMIGQFFELK
ncbi:histidine triad nucleotide-binding protein 3-like [Cyprinodon tularosa]|uniref:histidine triad nucleotide-binding protein 3-like n=1 Tax=Cyprinodon tularosa TaxID=77115 RepID=UPI0018E25A07|nr:histidine triad nucleotide-binding protein 3-like [Cyprinodon tularosa]